MSHFIDTFVGSLDIFAYGLWLTVELTFVSLFLSIFVGLFFAFLKISGIAPLTWIGSGYVWLVRGTPLVVQIFVIYYGLYEFVQLNAFWSGTLALTFHNGAYIAEIFRGAIMSIDNGQTEAARSLAMSKIKTMRRIILPQAFRRAIAPLGNQFIIGLKDTSLVSFVGLQELFGIATTQGSNHFDFLTYYLIVSVYYLLIVLFFTYVVSKLENTMSASD